MLRRYPIRLQHKVIVGPLVIWDFVRSRAVVLPSSEPGAAVGGKGNARRREEEVFVVGIRSPALKGCYSS